MTVARKKKRTMGGEGSKLKQEKKRESDTSKLGALRLGL